MGFLVLSLSLQSRTLFLFLCIRKLFEVNFPLENKSSATWNMVTKEVEETWSDRRRLCFDEAFRSLFDEAGLED